MKNITQLKRADEVDWQGKRVLVRGSLDVDDGENPRVDSVRQLTKWLLNQKVAKIRVIGHSETGFDICTQLSKEFPGTEFDSRLRDDPGEKNNDLEFAQQLAEGFDGYINECFDTSHRVHASLVSLPRVFMSKGLSVAAGPRFVKEITFLSKVDKVTGRKILIAGGVKVEDKVNAAWKLVDKMETILLGGRIPIEITNDKLQITNKSQILNSNKIILATLRPDGLDIDEESIKRFEMEINKAEVIIAAGVMGKYEEPGSSLGTEMILRAIANSYAYKIAGGGDIEMAISKYNLADKFDWISVGGGAMLEFLASGTLPGIEALIE